MLEITEEHPGAVHQSAAEQAVEQHPPGRPRKNILGLVEDEGVEAVLFTIFRLTEPRKRLWVVPRQSIPGSFRTGRAG